MNIFSFLAKGINPRTVKQVLNSVKTKQNPFYRKIVKGTT